MESLNYIELRGVVGNIRHTRVSGLNHARLSLATNFAFMDNKGCPVIETTWHTVSVWESPDATDLDAISKGDKLHIIGRLRSVRFTGADGEERSVPEVIARKVERIDSDENLSFQQ